MAEHTCVLCSFYRPHGEPRFADNVCHADRLRLERDLLAIPGLFRRVVDGDVAEADNRWYEATDTTGAPTGELRRRDPVAAVLPAGAVPARVHRPTVTGSREAPLPINVDAVDLTLTARAGTPTGDPRDQIGFLPVATVLQAWARHIRDAVRPDVTIAGRDVPQLVTFLHHQLPDAIDRLPTHLVDFADDLRRLAAAMRQILGDTDPIPQPLLGVRCRHCATMSALVPWSTGEYVECRICGQLYTPADRHEMARTQVADLTRPRLISVDGRLTELESAP